LGQANCDPQADCMDMTHGFTCKCRHGFSDISPDPINRPGRKCSKLTNTCDSPNFSGCNPKTSKCIGTRDGFVCRCADGYVDLNPSSPGINCSKIGMFRGVCSEIKAKSFIQIWHRPLLII
uniref:EGF_CA domain-containing protein n=1 Tax=Gongylonema pulchrum TaxID=637853 RepID=A0A183D8L8_9BILA